MWNLRIDIKSLNDDAPLPCFPNRSTESPVAFRALRTWCELKHPSCEEVSLTEADISTQIRRPARENPADQRVARRANNNIDAGGRWKNKASQLLVDCWTYGATFSSVFALKIRALLSGNLEREGESYDFYPSNFRWSALGERFQGFRLFYLGGDPFSSLNSSIFFPDENHPRRLKAYAGREQTSRFRNAIPRLSFFYLMLPRMQWAPSTFDPSRVSTRRTRGILLHSLFARMLRALVLRPCSLTDALLEYWNWRFASWCDDFVCTAMVIELCKLLTNSVSLFQIFLFCSLPLRVRLFI